MTTSREKMQSVQFGDAQEILELMKHRSSMQKAYWKMFHPKMSHQYGTEGGKSLMQKSREDTDVLNAKGFRGTWKTTVAIAVQEWMRGNDNEID